MRRFQLTSILGLTVCLLFSQCALAQQQPKKTTQAKDEGPPSIKALLIAGGCCHDYPNQIQILTEGISQRANVEWEIFRGLPTRDRRLAIYQTDDWAKDFDVIVHNECYGAVEDVEFVQRIVDGHTKHKVPMVAIHCSMHSYRNARTDAWRQLLGVTSQRHEKHVTSLEVVNRAADHPIMKPFGTSWVTPAGELYVIEKSWPNCQPLATAYAVQGKTDQTVIWINEYKGVRVFGTTLGHHNETMLCDEYLDVVTRGLLWSVQKLNDDGLVGAGYEGSGEEPILLPSMIRDLVPRPGPTPAQRPRDDDATPKTPSANETKTFSSIRLIEDLNTLPNRIAFGSCSNQNKPQPILETIAAQNPDMLIYLGDNIYGDTKDMTVLKSKYDQLAAKPEFQNLRNKVPVIAVWDDHDYGWNDAGKEYEFKDESKAIFLDFWNVPPSSPRREHPGIYGSHSFSQNGKTLQFILLDTRTFRDKLKLVKKPIPPGSGFKNAYQPHDGDSSATLLGELQWNWLESVLGQPADLRIICSSIQFGHEYNGWESWTNLPGEQKKMVELIRSTQANGVLFISGDVHWAEISKRQFPGSYPLYDVTASGLTEDWHNIEPNKYRVGEAYRKNHFGMIDIDWNQPDPDVSLKIIDIAGQVQLRHDLRISELQHQ